MTSGDCTRHPGRMVRSGCSEVRCAGCYVEALMVERMPKVGQHPGHGKVVVYRDEHGHQSFRVDKP